MNLYAIYCDFDLALKLSALTHCLFPLFNQHDRIRKKNFLSLHAVQHAHSKTQLMSMLKTWR